MTTFFMSDTRDAVSGIERESGASALSLSASPGKRIHTCGRSRSVAATWSCETAGAKVQSGQWHSRCRSAG